MGVAEDKEEAKGFFTEKKTYLYVVGIIVMIIGLIVIYRKFKKENTI
jgi:LPXTG-motif cell wall-anchored protein